MGPSVHLNRGYTYRERLGPGAKGKTALGYLCETYPHSSEPEWRLRFARGELLLDEVPTDAERVLAAGQSLAWVRPPWEEPPTPLCFDVLHEDDVLLAVAKPSGLPTLPGGGYYDNTLLSLVQGQFPGAAPVHRLGRGTSGLVLFAKTPNAAALLSKAWRSRAVEKRYRALSDGLSGPDEFDILAPIGLVPHARLGTVHAFKPTGKPSRTQARVLERRVGQSLFQVDIETGRPDQIRIHLAFIGHPLTGDTFFAPGGVPRVDAPGLPGEGGYLLHGERLRFEHPLSGATITLSAPIPDLLRAVDGS